MNKFIKMIVVSTITMLFIVNLGLTILIDNKIIQLITLIEFPWLVSIIKLITHLGSGLFYMFICTILFIKHKQLAILLCVNSTVALLINNILKLIFTRERPIEKLIEISGYSLPSGHACGAVAFYGTLIYYIYVKNSDKKKYNYVFLVLILLIGFTRIYLKVHYFSDVICGYLVGLCVMLSINKFIMR